MSEEALPQPAPANIHNVEVCITGGGGFVTDARETAVWEPATKKQIDRLVDDLRQAEERNRQLIQNAIADARTEGWQRDKPDNKPRRNKGGRPPLYPWHELRQAITAQANTPDGISSRRQVMNLIKPIIEGWSKQPDDRSINREVAKILPDDIPEE